MGSTLVWVFRFLHIVSAVAWVGGAIIWTMVIAPRLLRDGPPAIRRPVIEALIGAVPRYFHAVGGATIGFGILLLGQLVGWANFSATLQGIYLGTSYGYAIGLGLILAVAMFLEGFLIIEPTIKKLLATMQAQPPGPPSAQAQAALAALGKKMAIAGISSVTMGVIALGAMTWAVNQVR